MKAQEAAARVVKHLTKHGAAAWYDIVNCDCSCCCDDQMTYSRFQNARYHISHVRQATVGKPFICQQEADGVWRYSLTKYWTEAMLNTLWHMTYIATRLDLATSGAMATEREFGGDVAIDKAVRTMFTILRRDAERARDDVADIREYLKQIL